MFKRLTKLFFVPIGLVLFCSEFAAVAEKADLGRYWAGHKAVLETETDGDYRACQLTIKYSNDGLTYSASVSVEANNAWPDGKCSGKVDKFGNLERKECTPGTFNQRDIIGNVWAPKLDDVDMGSSGGCQWKDQTLLTAKKTFIEKQDANSSQKLAGQRSTDPKKKSTSQLSTNLKKKSIGQLSTDLKNAVYAKTLLADLKVFARKEPGVIDPQKLASLYFPVMQEIKSGEYKNSNSRFLELIDLIRQSSKFRNYHDSKMSERENKLKAQIDLLVKFIEEALSIARQKVTADPFSAHAANLNEVLEQYKTTPNNLSLKDLQKRASVLQARLRPLGVNVDAGVALVPSADQSATPANALTVKKSLETFKKGLEAFTAKNTKSNGLGALKTGSKKSTAKNTNVKSNNLANSSDKTLSKDDFLEKYFGKKNFNQLKELEGLLGTVQQYINNGQEQLDYFADYTLFAFSTKATLLGVYMYKVENNAIRFYQVAEPNSGSSRYLYGKPTKWSYVMFRKGNKAYSYNILNKTFKIKKLYNDLDEVKRLNFYPWLNWYSLRETPAGKSWVVGRQLWRSFKAEWRNTNAAIAIIQSRNEKLKEKEMVSANNQSFDTYKKRAKTLGEEVLNYTTARTIEGQKNNYWFALKDDKCTFQPVGDAYWGEFGVDVTKTPLNIRKINQTAFNIIREIRNGVLMLRVGKYGGGRTYFWLPETLADGTTLRDSARLNKAWSLLLEACPGKKTRF